MKSQWNKWLSEPGNIRIVAIEATALTQELILKHGLQGKSQNGYGDALVGGLLIASAHKSSESININAQGSGVYKQAIVDASPEGRVRGFLIEETNPEMHTYGVDGHNGPWGSGILSVLYTQNFQGQYPYRGIVPISTGHLDEALNEYYRDSEQLVSKVGLYIQHDGKTLRAARGALVQALGGATSEEQASIRALTVDQMRSLAHLADSLDDFRAEAARLFKGRNFRAVENQNLTSFCNCSRERIERALVLTGQDDALHVLGDEPFVEVICDFCRSQYRISAERIKALFSTDPSRLQ